MSNFWSSCLSRFEQELSPQQFNTWIRPLRIEGEDNIAEGLRLLAPNGFILKWVKEHYLGQIEELGNTYFSTPVSLSIVLCKETPLRSQVSDKTPSSVGSSNTPSDILPNTPSDSSAYEKTRLNPGFTFDNLIVGKANDLARAASIRVASTPGDLAYNPLFIYGGAGLGKTHMLHAIGNYIIENNRKAVVRYIHAEDYYSNFVELLLHPTKRFDTKPLDAFKRYYRSLDALLLDDIQFFNGKDRSQEEFFFVFNALIESKKQIVISCDTYPKDINGLEDRLVTRFDWGLTVQIEPPEIEMRVAILKKKAEMENLVLDNEVAFYIAKHLRSNVRELEGALKRVLAYSSFYGRGIDLELAKESLKDIVGAVNRQITVENIQKTVADYFQIKLADLYSSKRTRNIVRPRQIAMWLAKNLTSQSYPSIGEAFGGRDHTTVLHAIKTIDALRSKDSKLDHDVLYLTQVLKG